ncbi:MAG: hypothetical protein J5777_06755 [Clostridiales bacterium]|nr:hypothetical protein [Clostridiales bacterium]
MWQGIFGGILVFTGFYLIIKCFASRRKGVHLDATLVGFQEEKGTPYPLFKFTYEGEELTLPGGVPAEPKKFKYDEGENVRIIFNPSNRKFVDIEGSKTEYLYGIASIILGALFIYSQLRKMGIL